MSHVSLPGRLLLTHIGPQHPKSQSHAPQQQSLQSHAPQPQSPQSQSPQSQSPQSQSPQSQSLMLIQLTDLELRTVVCIGCKDS